MPRRPNTSPQTLAVLEALLERPGAWQHGYDLSRRTNLRSGTLYPILLRLADQGLLDARWEGPERPGRPPRHVYRLATAGAEVAARLLHRPPVLSARAEASA